LNETHLVGAAALAKECSLEIVAVVDQIEPPLVTRPPCLPACLQLLPSLSIHNGSAGVQASKNEIMADKPEVAKYSHPLSQVDTIKGM
jgi:hypothetical protein